MTGLTVFTLKDFIDVFFFGFTIAFISAPLIVFWVIVKFIPDFFQCRTCWKKFNVKE